MTIGGGTTGNAPEPFSGEHHKSKDFMRSFIRWWKLNYDKPVFQQPYKRVALCLNYIRGKNIEDWADEQQTKLDDNVTNGYGHDSEHHWNTFKTAYKTTYTDLGEHVNAEHEIERLKMERGDLNSYIAIFNKLMALTGYMDVE